MINTLREEREAQLRRQRVPKRKGSEPTDDGSRDPLREVRGSTLPPPIPPGATVPSTSAASSSGQKRRAEDPPDDPRVDDQGQAEVVIDNIDKRYARRCATCECSFASNNQLHRHIRKHRHQRLGEAPRARTSATISTQRFQEESRKHFEMNTMPIGCDVPSGSVMGLPPDADEAGSRSLQIQDASGQITDQPKPVDNLSRGHPGQRIPTHKITTRDQQWQDIGSGMVARTFKQVSRLRTTSAGRPCIDDVFHRKI